MSSTSLVTALNDVKSRFIAESKTSKHYTAIHSPFVSRVEVDVPLLEWKERNIDVPGEYTAGLFGHSHPVILDSLRNALSNGLNFRGVNPLDGELARKICERFGLAKALFTSSAIEANIMALAAARFTLEGKSSILSSLPSGSLAAILVEPMQGSAGCFPADPSFLEYLSTTAAGIGAVLIFDETMTSRLHWGGLQAKFNMKPGITTFGKYLAGGMSFGAFGGKEEIMNIFTRSKHSGTFNNNIMSMTGGVAASQVLTPEILDGMNALGDSLRVGIGKVLELTNGRITITGVGSLMCFHFLGMNGDEKEAAMLKELFFFHLIVEEGIYMASRGFISLTIVHEKKHIDRFIQAVGNFLVKYKGLFV